MIGMIGVLMILFTKMNQSLHDMITKTVVIENGLFQTMKKNSGPNQADAGMLPRGRVNAPHR